MAKPEVGSQAFDSSVINAKSDRPSPQDLDEYLPWACGQLECEFSVSVIKVTQAAYVSVSGAKKNMKSKPKITQSSNTESDFRKDDRLQSASSDGERNIKIYAIYDQLDHLVELKFEKIKELPQMLFKILGLVIQFQKHLLTITIRQGMNIYCLYEINKFLSTCNVTDLCFDDTYLKEGSYSILFENYTLIKRISLSRCRINDAVLETIASKLVYPLPASKTLVVLDLSTNKITDLGAKHLAHALRSNRCLGYLNLSDNGLTDVGAQLLFDSLMKFCLTDEELVEAKQRILKYHLRKTELTTQILKELRADQIKGKRKPIKPALAKPSISKKGKGLEREGSIKGVTEDKSFPDLYSLLYDKACVIAEVQMGALNDPFSRNNLVTKDGIVYCLGNNTLCYLNLSYNNLGYISLKKLLEVLTTQRISQRKPQGLINVSVDGNFMPGACMEMMQINVLLNYGASDKNIAKKRAVSKSVSSVR